MDRYEHATLTSLSEHSLTTAHVKAFEVAIANRRDGKQMCLSARSRLQDGICLFMRRCDLPVCLSI